MKLKLALATVAVLALGSAAMAESADPRAGKQEPGVAPQGTTQQRAPAMRNSGPMRSGTTGAGTEDPRDSVNSRTNLNAGPRTKDAIEK